MCSYCGCHDNTFIGRFMDEHELLINLTGDLRRAIAADGHEAVGAACDAIATLFSAHAADEEAGIFHEMRELEAYAAGVDRLCGEHHWLDAAVATLRAGDYSGFDAFSTQLREHIDAEDNGLFPAANIELDGEAWDRVADAVHENLHARGEVHGH